jgi:hypothetical protein
LPTNSVCGAAVSRTAMREPDQNSSANAHACAVFAMPYASYPRRGGRAPMADSRWERAMHELSPLHALRRTPDRLSKPRLITGQVEPGGRAKSVGTLRLADDI